MALLDQQDHQAQPETVERTACQDYKDLVVSEAQLDHRGHEDQMELKEVPEDQDHPAHEAHLESVVFRAQSGHQGAVAIRVNKVDLEEPDREDQVVNVESPDNPDPQDQEDQQDQEDHKAAGVKMEDPDPPDLEATAVSADLRENKEAPD